MSNSQIIIHLHHPSGLARKCLDSIQSEFASRLVRADSSHASVGTVDSHQCHVFFLPDQPESWNSLLGNRSQRAPTERTIAVIEDRFAADIRPLLPAGIDDVITLPDGEQELIEKIREYSSDDNLTDDARLKAKLLAHFGMDQFVGESAAFLECVRQIPVLSRSDSAVLITGETGTGKESFARAIHYLGRRRSKPFVPLNSGAIPDTLFENELFGHARGAYTDANQNQGGLVAEAEGGTLFLDEINSLTPQAQVKLLRFLEEKKFKPLGSSVYVPANIRLIAASNVDLRSETGKGKIREDLYYRINVLGITLPPLRSRRGDIPLLAEHFLKKYSEINGGSRKYFSPEVIQTFMQYSWPGNVRELQNVVERAATMSSSNIIRQLSISLATTAVPVVMTPQPYKKAKQEIISEFERIYLAQILRECNGNLTQAAHATDMDRSAFRRLARKHGLATGAF